MPVHFNPTDLLFLVAVVFLAGMIGAAVLGVIQTVLRARCRQADIRAPFTAYRPCRYCRWGDALLHEESVKFEYHDRVTVRCYVCNSCGLPQWFVQRTSVTHFAES